MKFNIELDMDMFAAEGWFEEYNFKKEIKNKIIDKLFIQFSNSYIGDYHNQDLNKLVKEIVKEHQSEIIESVIKNVSENILKKKQIVEITPKAKELSEISSENKDYFMKLIEECIAKKFK